MIELILRGRLNFVCTMTTTQVVSTLLESQDQGTPTIDMLGAALERVSSISDKHLTSSGEGQTSLGKVKTSQTGGQISQTEGQVSQEEKQDCQEEGQTDGDESSLKKTKSSIQENGVDKRQ